MAARIFGYRMRKQCDRCGLVFEPDEGEMTGGMAISMVLTSILGTAFAIYAAFGLHANVFVAAAALILGGLAFGLWFHPHARGLWVGVLYATGQLLPPTGTVGLVDPRGEPVPADLHDSATWERFGWGPYQRTARSAGDGGEADADRDAHGTDGRVRRFCRKARPWATLVAPRIR